MVTIKFGNVPIKMDHTTALEISRYLRIHGRRAKAIAGDKSMTLKALGMLTDAESDERTFQAARDGTAIFK